MRRKSTIAWCRTSAPRRTSAGRSTSGSSTPPLNQFTSPPDEKARSPAPVTISPRSGARSASQADAIVSSPIISGLIALSESGRFRVRVPISPSTSIESVASSGADWMVAVLIAGRASSRVGSTAEANPNLVPGEREPATERRATATRAARSAGRLPVQRPQGEVLYVGKATSIRKRVAGHFSGRSSGEMVGRITSIDFLVTETEAEALLAEQQFIKRHRPGSTSACATTSPTRTSGSASTRSSPASTSLASAIARRGSTSGPTRRRSGCARRSTCSAACSSTGPARGASPVGARACPASTTTSSAAPPRASAMSTGRSTGAGSTRSSTSSPGATATSSATSSARWARPPTRRSSNAPRSSATGSRRCAR